MQAFFYINKHCFSCISADNPAQYERYYALCTDPNLIQSDLNIENY